MCNIVSHIVSYNIISKIVLQVFSSYAHGVLIWWETDIFVDTRAKPAFVYLTIVITSRMVAAILYTVHLVISRPFILYLFLVELFF